ncbi:MAG TPA: APC family permease [Pyrinomonadaceae bacterium]|jgi:amino acid transporter|nr:APC family permease [Pyrinomonadaceae bacterium]
MNEPKLVRGIGRWDFTAIVINTIIGAGIFGLPSKVYAQIGSYSLIAFVACALIIGLVTVCYAEVSSRFSATGGPYLYAKEAFGPVVGFEVGWLYWVVRVTTFAANCNLMVTYLGFFIPGANGGIIRLGLITLVVAVLVAVNLIGVRESAMATNIFTIGKLLPLFLFVVAGALFVQPRNFHFEAVPGYSDFSTSVLLLIYAFVGFEAAVVLSGETKDPQRNVPFGTLTALAIVAVLYILIQIVSIGTLPELAGSERPLADAASVFMGAFGASFITVGALVSIIGNLHVGVMSSTRVLFAMSEQRELPAVIGRTHKRFKTPFVSIILTGIVVLILAIQSTFITAVAIATITRLLVYATTCLALPIFRRRKDIPEAKFTAPFGIVACVLSLGLIVWLLTRVDFAKEGIAIVFAATAGLIIFSVYRMFSKREGPGSSVV